MIEPTHQRAAWAIVLFSCLAAVFMFGCLLLLSHIKTTLADVHDNVHRNEALLRQNEAVSEQAQRNSIANSALLAQIRKAIAADQIVRARFRAEQRFDDCTVARDAESPSAADLCDGYDTLAHAYESEGVDPP